MKLLSYTIVACIVLFNTGLFAQSIVSVSNTNYPCTVSNRLILVTAHTTNVLITLPPATISGEQISVTVQDGTFNVTVQKNASDNNLVDPTGAAYMGGSCASGEAVSLVSDGNKNWYVTDSRNIGCSNWSANAPSGGTGLPSATGVGQMLYWSGTKWATLAAGGSGQVLTGAGAAIPTWQSSSGSIPSGGIIGFTTASAQSGFTNTGLNSSMGGNSWATKSSTNFTAQDYAMSASANGKVYVVGGWNGSLVGTIQEYDPSTDSWATKSNSGFTARTNGVAVTVNNIVYVIGGGATPGSTASNKVEAFDPVANSWSTKANMPTARIGLAAEVVNGIIYAIGGHDGAASPTRLSTVEAYDPVANSWSTKTNMPTARDGMSAVALNGVIYSIGGYSGSAFLSLNEAYNVAGNTWSTVSSSGFTARGKMGTIVANGLIYAVGGYNASLSSRNESYDAVANSWTTVSTTSTGYTARYNTCSASLGLNLYILCGDNGPSALNNNEVYTPATTFYWFSKN